MKKILALLILPLLFAFSSNAQSYGNEWIDYSKTHYRFVSEEDGLHRVDYNTLVGSGMSNLLGAQFKVFTKGQEVPIYVSTNGIFGPGDYIEFYATGNTGYFDTQLYVDPDHQSHDRESLFNDEAAYFITQSSSTNNLRTLSAVNNITNAPPAQTFFIHKSEITQFNIHHRGQPKTEIGEAKAWFADFEKGEGYTGPQCTSSTPQFMRLSTKQQYGFSGQNAQVELSVVGLDGSIGAFLDQHIQVFTRPFGTPASGTPDINHKFIEYAVNDFEFEVPMSQLGSIATDIWMHALDGVDGNFPYESKFAGTLASISYPHTFDFENKKTFNFTLDVSTGIALDISNFNGGSQAILYDLTANKRYEVNNVGGVYKVHIPFDSTVPPGKRDFYITTSSSSELNFASGITNRVYTNYANTANQGDFVIVYHKSLTTGPQNMVEEYRKYRQIGEVTSSGASSPNSTFNVVTVDIDELYDQFAHGIEKHPLSVKNFVNYISNGPFAWQAEPEHMFLLGKGIGYQDFRSSPALFDQCLIPTYGQQPSDTALSGSNNVDYRPQMGTGRLPVANGTEIKAYLDKVIEYEQVFVDGMNDCTVAGRKMMKEILFVTKGWGQVETDIFHDYSVDYKAKVTGGSSGWSVAHDLEETTDHGPGPVSAEFTNSMNNGLALLLYTGHSHGEYWEFNGHFDIDSSNPTGPTTLWPNNFSNEGKYPFVLSNSCFVGQIHRPGGESQAEDWVLADNRGSIGFLATLALAYPSFLDIFTDQFVENMTTDMYGQTVGRLIKQTIKDVYVQNSAGIKATCLEFTYAGDPGILLYHFKYPEYILNNTTPVSANQVQVGVYNMGKAVPGQQLGVQVVSTSPSGVVTNHPVQYVAAPAYFNSFTLNISPGNEGGTYTHTAILDPFDTILEDCEAASGVALQGKVYLEGLSNNAGVMTTNLNSSGLLPTTQPYNVSPHFYNGNEAVSSFAPDIVDWVLLELRAANTPGFVVAEKAALLDTQGRVRDVNGNDGVLFDGVAPGNYIVVVNHRNHISVMTASNLSHLNSASLDLTTSTTKVLGQSQLKNVGGNFVMLSGDIDGNKTVNFLDFLAWFGQNNTLNQYLATDIDGNGTVNFLDFLKWFSNNNHLGWFEI